MLWIFAAAFAVIWAVAMAKSHTLDGYIHLLLGAALVMVFVKLVKGPVRAPRRARHLK